MDSSANNSFISLKGKVAVVTGASRGIGRSIAMTLAGAGATVVAIARTSGLLQTLQAEISAAGGESVPYTCDVSDFPALHKCLLDASKRFGRIDILVNNAGVYLTDPIKDMSLTEWNSVMNINSTSAFVATKVLLEGMIEAKWGRVVFISSISGEAGEPYGAAYSASKFAMIGLMQSLALEVARYGVTANAICPGWVNTDMAKSIFQDEKWCRLNALDPDQAEELSRLSVPQERLIEPSEVAALALYLCSDFARGITGQSINICGGLSIH
jgi:NAD(P)-dependent dehydrogenase (short-subunit alcohol dehydrogenase family)